MIKIGLSMIAHASTFRPLVMMCMMMISTTISTVPFSAFAPVRSTLMMTFVMMTMMMTPIRRILTAI